MQGELSAGMDLGRRWGMGCRWGSGILLRLFFEYGVFPVCALGGVGGVDGVGLVFTCAFPFFFGSHMVWLLGMAPGHISWHGVGERENDTTKYTRKRSDVEDCCKIDNVGKDFPVT